MAGRKLTKSEEKILERLRSVNNRALAGLCTDPADPKFTNRAFRFVRRLYEAGDIIWVPYTKELGAGWVIPGTPVWLSLQKGPM